MVMGGGALVVFLLLIVLFVWIMLRTDKDKLFDAADSDYRGGSYVQAIAKYNTFIEKFGADDRASLARVRIGLAKLWQATPNGANWPTALQVAQEEVNKMAVENAFKDAHSDLASLLSKIAENLVAEARKKPTADLVAKARKALEMAENPRYVPKELRPESKLGEARASLGIAEHELARGNELDKALAAMQKATKESKTADAYAACGALLHQYPDMTNDPRLKKMLLAVSAAQQALVQTVSEAKSAAKDEAQTAAIRSVTLAQCDAKGKVGDADGQIALAAVDGAVYGLDAVTGRVLWRRMVGFDANPQAATFPPTPLSSEPGSDALVVATAHNELLRLEAATGHLKWRYVVGEPFDANPVIAGDKILVATRSGKLITIAAASGESKGYIQFPQQLNVAPVVDVRRALIYQVASHTNLFILSLDQGVCKHVGYLGHEAASITTAPVMIGDYLLVSINGGARDAVLRVYTIEPNRSDKPDPWLKLVQEIPLGGHLQMSPLVEGQRVLVTTNSGVVRVFELSATDVKNPLREVANTAIEGGGNLTRFALMQNGQFWIADNRLTKYDVQAARGRLMPKSIDCVDSAFLQPPVAVGQAVVSGAAQVGNARRHRVGPRHAGIQYVLGDADRLSAGRRAVGHGRGRQERRQAGRRHRKRRCFQDRYEPKRLGGGQRSDRGVGFLRSQAARQLRRPARRRRAGHQRRQGGRPDRRLRAGKRYAADALAESARRARLCAGRRLAAGCWRPARPARCTGSIPTRTRAATSSNWPSRSSRESSRESISTG